MYEGWYVVSACAIISMFFSGTIYMGFTAFIEPVSREMGWSYAQISFAASLRGLETGLLAAIFGMLMDRYGLRALVAGGSIVAGFGLLLLSRVSSLLMFYLSFAVICVGTSTAPTTLLMSAVARWFRKRQGLAMGITASGVALGGLLVPVVTFVVDTYGWRRSMFMIGLGAWTIPLPLSLMLRHKPGKQQCLLDGGKDFSEEHEARATAPDDGAGDKGIRTVLSTGVFWILTAAFLCHIMVVSAVVTHIMPFFSTIGLDRTLSSMVGGLVPVAGVVGRVGFGWLGDRIDRVKVATFALALAMAGVWILIFVTTSRPWLLALFILIFGIGWGGIVPMLPGLVIKFFGKGSLGGITGCINSIMMVGLIVGPLLAGWIFDRQGSYDSAWLLMGFALLLTTSAFCLLLWRPQVEPHGQARGTT